MNNYDPHIHGAEPSSSGIPILPRPPTEEERRRLEAEEHDSAREERERVYKDRQLELTEAANRLAEAANKLATKNFYLSKSIFWLTILTVLAACYQGWMNKKSWETAQSTLEQMKSDSIESGKQFQVQLGHFDAGLGRSDVLANHAASQAASSQSSADTAKQAVHISERAYLEVSSPQLDASPATQKIYLPILNSGHIPSGELRGDAYTRISTWPEIQPAGTLPTNFIFRRSARPNPIPISGSTIVLPVFYDKTLLEAHRQRIYVVGTFYYNDGFQGTPEQKLSFCSANLYDSATKTVSWTGCDEVTLYREISTQFEKQMKDFDSQTGNKTMPH